MKINQLFSKKVDTEVLLRLLHCFGLGSLEDKRFFSKHDLNRMDTLVQIQSMRLNLSSYYLPCKAKIYLDHINEKRAITILKQVLRLHGYYLQSKEKNINTRKVIFYQIMSETEKSLVPKMRKDNTINIIHFD
jgi:hypothetical protein